MHEIGTFVEVLQRSITEVLTVASPILGAALIVGLIIALFQAVTSIQEQTLTFVPKILTILLMIFLLGGWMMSSLSSYTIGIFSMIPSLAK